MIQPYSLGTSITAIDGGNIATGTIAATAILANSITTNQLAAGSILAVNLAVGPNYQFTSTAGGTPLTLNTDGSFSLPATGGNPTDARWVMDGTRSYSASQYVKTFAATLTNPGGVGGFGMVLNVAAPWSTTGSTGLLIWFTSTVACIYRVTGVGNYGAAITTQAITLTGIDRLVIQYYGTQSTPRMRVFLNSVEIFAGWCSDTNLGSSGGALGGYAGFLLANSSILVSQIIMGNQPTTIEDGAVNTNQIAANAVTAGKLVITGAGGLVGALNTANGGSSTTTIDGASVTTGTITTNHISSVGLSAAVIKSGYISSALIAANSITTGQLLIQNFGQCLNPDPNFLDATAWNSTSYTGNGGTLLGTLQAISDGIAGYSSWRNAAGTGTQLFGSIKIPVDGTKTYRVKCWARSNGANGTLYLGVVCLDHSGNNLGGGPGGSYAYIAASSVSANSSWVEYDGYIGGTAFAGDSVTPQVWQFPAGTCYIVPMALCNYNGTAGYWELQDFEVAQQVHGSMVVRGSITADHIATTGLDGGNIKTGSILSQGTGGVYATGTYSGSYTAGNGFKLSNTPFSVLNYYGRSQNVQAEFASTVMVSGMPLGRSLAMPLQALYCTSPLDAASGTWATSQVWYQGNNLPTTRGGAPNIACLSVAGVTSSTYSGVQICGWEFSITPTSYSSNPGDNLDGMRYLRVRLYAMLTSASPFADFCVPISDRLYDGASGIYKGSFMWQWRSTLTQGSGLGIAPANEQNYLYGGYMRCTLYNAYGASADQDFAYNTVAGTAMGSCTITGQTGGSGGGIGGSGGGGGMGCVPAGALVPTVVGMFAVEKITPGMQVLAFDDVTLAPAVAEVAGLVVYTDRQLYRIHTDQGTLLCSHDHRLARATGLTTADYPAARDLQVDDILFAHKDHRLESAIVKQVEPLDEFTTVYHLMLKTGHVFVADGFAAHNMKSPN